MGCERASARVYHYLDGRLTFYRRWRIARHLDRCPPCQQGFDFEIELRQFVAARCRDEIPPELRRRIADALAREAEQVERGE
jgi:mycothiol system anti-sigma-R factor